ncbi:MAG: family 43 glycosylhydrolase [Bacteroidales bacterium]
MKRNIYQIISALFLAGTVISISLPFQSCSDDFAGDGIDSVKWTGSILPDDSMYLNPVFAPDLTAPSVFKGAGGYYAYGNENEWSNGFVVKVPIVTSKNLMRWDFYGNAFEWKPVWTDDTIKSVSVSYSGSMKLILMFYNAGNAIGLAYSESPLGPFTDFGKILDTDSIAVDNVYDPFFIQVNYKIKVGVRWILVEKNMLFFGRKQGIFCVELSISANAANQIAKVAIKKGPFKVAGNAFSRIYIAPIDKKYYLFGTIGQKGSTSIAFGASDSVQGPYHDKNGNDLVNSEGTVLVANNPSSQYQSPCNVGGIFADVDGNYWIIYNAFDVQRKLLPSGKERYYLILSPLKFDDKRWPLPFEVKGGWCYPRVSQ